MLDHVAVVALMALVAGGAHTAMLEGMILERLGKLFAKMPAFLHKPTHTCPPCMVSLWGTATWFAVGGFSLWYLPLHIFAACGLAAYLNRE